MRWRRNPILYSFEWDLHYIWLCSTDVIKWWLNWNMEIYPQKQPASSSTRTKASAEDATRLHQRGSGSISSNSRRCHFQNICVEWNNKALSLSFHCIIITQQLNNWRGVVVSRVRECLLRDVRVYEKHNVSCVSHYVYYCHSVVRTFEPSYLGRSGCAVQQHAQQQIEQTFPCQIFKCEYFDWIYLGMFWIKWRSCERRAFCQHNTRIHHSFSR